MTGNENDRGQCEEPFGGALSGDAMLKAYLKNNGDLSESEGTP